MRCVCVCRAGVIWHPNESVLLSLQAQMELFMKVMNSAPKDTTVTGTVAKAVVRGLRAITDSTLLDAVDEEMGKLLKTHDFTEVYPRIILGILCTHVNTYIMFTMPRLCLVAWHRRGT
jgi:hypothetical protein